MKRTIENYDKIIHFVAGAIVTMLSVVMPAFCALMLCIVVAAAKEIYDYFHPNHTPCYMDFIVTVCGGMFGLMLVQSINVL